MVEKEVVVVGGGPTGIAAGIAAARTGADTLLIERYGVLGGMATLGLVNHWDSITLMEITGIAREVYENMKKRDGLLEFPYEKIEMPFTYWEAGCGFDLEAYKQMLMEMVQEAQVGLLLHTFATAAIREGGRVIGLEIQSKTGKQEIRSKAFVDATGDADIAAFAGAPFQKGAESGELMAPTLCFTVGGVDTEKLRQYLKNNPDELGLHPRLGKFIRNVDASSIWQGFRKLIDQARANGDLTIPLPEQGIGTVRLPTPGYFHVNVTHAPGIDGTKGESLTQGEISERKGVTHVFSFMKKYIPGYEKSYLAQTGIQIGIRETRRVKGDYYLTVEDLKQAKEFDDVIMQGRWAHQDIHSGRPAQHDEDTTEWIFELIEGPYQVPYRCLLPQQVENLIVGGRSIWTDRQVNGTLRCQPICMATGQAAGVAAALSAKRGVGLRELDVPEIQRVLREQGVHLKT